MKKTRLLFKFPEYVIKMLRKCMYGNNYVGTSGINYVYNQSIIIIY